jgi:hypothetical protein
MLKVLENSPTGQDEIWQEVFISGIPSSMIVSAHEFSFG